MHSAIRMLFRNVSWVSVSQGTRAIEAIVRSILFAWILGVEQYAVVAIFAAGVSTVVELFNFHVGACVIRFCSEFEAEHDSAGVRSVVKYGYVATLSLLVIASVMGIGIALIWRTQDLGVWLVCLFVFGCATQQLDATNKSNLRYFNAFKQASIADSITSFSSVALLLIAWRSGISSIDSCLTLWAITMIFPGLVSCLITRQVLRREIPGWLNASFLPIRDKMRSVVTFLFNSSAITSVQRLVGRGDILLLAYVLGEGAAAARQVALYDVCKKMASSLSVGRAVFSMAVFPQISKEIQQRSDGVTPRLLRFTLMFGLPICLLGGAVCALIGGPLVVTVYGREYAGGSVLFGLLILNALLQLVFFWGSSVAYASRQDLRYLLVVIVSAVVCGGVILLLSERLAAVGAAIGVITFWCLNGLFFLYCASQLRVENDKNSLASEAT